MLSARLKEYLEQNHVSYEKISHPLAYTAQETAELTHISGKEFAKTVIVKADQKMIMVVIPANQRIDLKALKTSLGATSIEIASESEFSQSFPGCDIGAMPALGNLYGVDVIADQKLTEDKEISFNAGTHTDLIKLKYTDFENLVHPKVMPVSTTPISKTKITREFFDDLESWNVSRMRYELADDFLFSGFIPELLNKKISIKAFHSLWDAFDDLSLKVRNLREVRGGVRITLDFTGKHESNLDLTYIQLPVIPKTGRDFHLVIHNLELRILHEKIIAMHILDVEPEAGLAGILMQLGVRVPEKLL